MGSIAIVPGDCHTEVPPRIQEKNLHSIFTRRSAQVYIHPQSVLAHSSPLRDLLQTPFTLISKAP